MAPIAPETLQLTPEMVPLTTETTPLASEMVSLATETPPLATETIPLVNQMFSLITETVFCKKTKPNTNRIMKNDYIYRTEQKGYAANMGLLTTPAVF